jgi:hypothetical protein
MICELCKNTAQHPAAKKAHERLVQTGVTERVTRSPRTKPTWITRFECQLCDALWRHEDDTHNGRGHWSLVRHSATVE